MSQPFHNHRFPSAISLRSRGGPQRRTEIVTLSSGHEQRNTRWADSRRRYEAGYGMASLDDVHKVLAFFEQQRGRLYGFRWKDHSDFKSCKPSATPGPDDQQIGIGDGVQTRFQLIKTYGTGQDAYPRAITRPVVGTVLVSVNGAAQTQTTDFAVDAGIGVIDFVTAPPMGATISVGFEFDVPVRFEQDTIELNLDAFNAGQIPDITLIEIKS